MNFTGIGAVVGIIVGLIIAVIIVKICNSNGKIKTDYDERQEAVRGRGYRYASYTAWVMLGICIVLNLGDVNMHMDAAVIYFTVLIASALVSVSYFIWKDAYFGRNNNTKSYLIALAIVTLINIIVSVQAIAMHEFVVDGIITHRAINLECALIIIIIGIQLAIKNFISKSDEQEED